MVFVNVKINKKKKHFNVLKDLKVFNTKSIITINNYILFVLNTDSIE